MAARRLLHQYSSFSALNGFTDFLPGRDFASGDLLRAGVLKKRAADATYIVID